MNALAWIAVIGSPLVSLIGIIVTTLASRRQDKASADKTSADALQVIQESTLALLEPMQRQVDQLRAENTYLAADVRELKDRLGVVEDDRDVLVAAIRIHAAWEDSGRPDPPGAPSVGSRVRAILARLNDAA